MRDQKDTTLLTRMSFPSILSSKDNLRSSNTIRGSNFNLKINSNDTSHIRSHT